jgi:hypothetical protein
LSYSMVILGWSLPGRSEMSLLPSSKHFCNNAHC